MEVKFVFSDIYEMVLRATAKSVYMKDPKENPILMKGVKKDSVDILRFKDALETRWNEVKQPLLDSFEKVSGLKWDWKEQTCYVVKEMDTVRAFADPLTIRCMKDIDNAVGMLLHELAHLLVDKHIGLDSELYKLGLERFKDKTAIIQFHLLISLIFRAAKDDLNNEYFDQIYEKNRKYMGGALEIVEGIYGELDKSKNVVEGFGEWLEAK